LVSKWLGEPGPEANPPRPSIPEGRRLYCIGDIHGRADLLRQLHGRVEADAAGFDGDKRLIYLGDYIDRGEQSKEVIDLLLEQPLPGFETVHILGNHEQTLLDFLQHPRSAASWLSFGGRACLDSYGIKLGPGSVNKGITGIRDEFQRKIPEKHLAFFEGCKVVYCEGGYCFVHAGIRPGVPLGDQRNEDLLWIREDFTGSRQQHEYVVVHGHTISEEVEFRPNRIGIDTGAFYTGVLTCLVLEGVEQRLLQTGESNDSR